MDEQHLTEIRARFAAYETAMRAPPDVLPLLLAVGELKYYAAADIAALLEALATTQAERNHHHRALQYVRQVAPDVYQRALNEASRRAALDAAQEATNG